MLITQNWLLHIGHMYQNLTMNSINMYTYHMSMKNINKHTHNTKYYGLRGLRLYIHYSTFQIL
jgi:hypothetical protein